MRKFPLILLLFSISYSFSQHTDHFKEIVKDLKVKESYTDTLFFASGVIKSIKDYSIYEYNKIEYDVLTGKSIEYYRNGKVEFEEWFDNYGNCLTGKVFDRNGNLLSYMDETEIDTDSENLELFVESLSGMGDYPNSTLNYKRLIKLYTYSKKLQKWYVYQEDHLTFLKNKKKEMLRKFLNSDGEVYRTKNKHF